MSCYKKGEEQQRLLIERGLIENDFKGRDYVSFSGGKDSSAMLMKLIDNKVKVDEITFADTEMEYDALYSYLDFFEKKNNITINRLTPRTYLAKELMDKNNKIKAKFDSQRIPCVDPTYIYPEEWTPETVISLWAFWFYGIVSSGKNRGTVRGYPLINSFCWFSREAKIKPLQKAMRDARKIYVGIASDEKKRLNSIDPRVNFYLDEIDMTEKDCATYLQKIGLHNPIYDFTNRSGCKKCQKQGIFSLYTMWKDDKIGWDDAVHWDSEGRRVRGQGGFLDRKANKELKLFELQKRFEEGFVPKFNLKFECHSCSVFTEYYKEEDQE
jgi:hypothetical protein